MLVMHARSTCCSELPTVKLLVQLLAFVDCASLTLSPPSLPTVPVLRPCAPRRSSTSDVQRNLSSSVHSVMATSQAPQHLSTTPPAPSRSPSFTTTSGAASDAEVSMEAEEESADDSDFLDGDLDDPANSSLSLSITVPALATPKPHSSSTPWPFTSISQASPTLLPTTAPYSPDLIAPAAIPASSLPHEILLHILRLLPAPALSPALRVCKAWCQCGVELLWHKPAFTTLPPLTRMLSVISSPDQTFPYPTFVRRLNFSALHASMDDATLLQLIPCVRLERLTLAGCKTLEADSLMALLSRCERLIALDLSDVINVTDEVAEVVARNCPKLQGLNLSGCKEITDRGIEAIARACPGLRRVSNEAICPHRDSN